MRGHLPLTYIPRTDQTVTDQTDHTTDVDGKTFPQQTKQPQTDIDVDGKTFPQQTSDKHHRQW